MESQLGMEPGMEPSMDPEMELGPPRSRMRLQEMASPLPELRDMGKLPPELPPELPPSPAGPR